MVEMDKITLENASNSEISASASDALSIQAQKLDSMILALRKIVGGKAGKHLSNGHSEDPAFVPHAALEEGKRREPAKMDSDTDTA